MLAVLPLTVLPNAAVLAPVGPTTTDRTAPDDVTPANAVLLPPLSTELGADEDVPSEDGPAGRTAYAAAEPDGTPAGACGCEAVGGANSDANGILAVEAAEACDCTANGAAGPPGACDTGAGAGATVVAAAALGAIGAADHPATIGAAGLFVGSDTLASTSAISAADGALDCGAAPGAAAGPGTAAAAAAAPGTCGPAVTATDDDDCTCGPAEATAMGAVAADAAGAAAGHCEAAPPTLPPLSVLRAGMGEPRNCGVLTPVLTPLPSPAAPPPPPPPPTPMALPKLLRADAAALCDADDDDDGEWSRPSACAEFNATDDACG